MVNTKNRYHRSKHTADFSSGYIAFPKQNSLFIIPDVLQFDLQCWQENGSNSALQSTSIIPSTLKLMNCAATDKACRLSDVIRSKSDTVKTVS